MEGGGGGGRRRGNNITFSHRGLPLIMYASRGDGGWEEEVIHTRIYTIHED